MHLCNLPTRRRSSSNIHIQMYLVDNLLVYDDVLQNSTGAVLTWLGQLAALGGLEAGGHLLEGDRTGCECGTSEGEGEEGEKGGEHGGRAHCESSCEVDKCADGV
jgi:hypothetical protein